MRRFVLALAAGGLISALVAPTVGAGQSSEPDEQDLQVLAAGGQIAPKAAPTSAAPKGANPYLALVPDVTKVDFAGWRRYVERQSEARAAADPPAVDPIVVEEQEPAGTRAGNGSAATAEPIPGFGTRRRENNRAQVLGELSSETVTPVAIPAGVEDDGAIPLATATGIGPTRSGVTTSGTIGDGPHGTAAPDPDPGDFDFYAVAAVAGEEIVADTDTPTGPLDTTVSIYDAAGTRVAFNDDSTGLDSLATYLVTTAGTYYVAIAGFPVTQANPFDSGSGSGVVASTSDEGPYNLTITAGEVDVDYYSVRLRRGDVLGASLAGAGTRITLYGPAVEEVMGSTQDATFIYPPASPLPGGGNAVADHVADETGTHYLAVSNGDGAYEITVEAYRPTLESERPVQTLFVDFDGARVNTAIFGGPGVRELSPLSAFLPRWGLTAADLDPLIDAIVAEVEESVRADMEASGLNDNFRLEVTNSRDQDDTFGKKNVSRVVVGGTIAESGVSTIGIAQSIDPGNFETEETALVLLDVLSNPTGAASLNTYLTAASDRIGFVGQAVGNVTSHEAGHYFGNFHVDNLDRTRPNLMDQGGANFDILFGVGPDRVGGTADDVDVDFGEDTFNISEGFTGTEDTLSRLAFGLTR